MQEHAVTHAQEIDPLFAVVLAVIDHLDRKVVCHSLDRLIEGDAMLAVVARGLGAVPFEALIKYILVSRSWSISAYVDRAAARSAA